MGENITKPSLTTSERIVRYWLPVGLMMSLIFIFSTDLFSGENTERVIAWVFSLFGKDASLPDLRDTNFAIRKFAHFFEYAVLACFLFRAFRANNTQRWHWRWAIYALSIVVFWSLLDELHQAFTRTRGSSIYDSLLDSSGGLFALLVIRLSLFFRGGEKRSTY